MHIRQYIIKFFIDNVHVSTQFLFLSKSIYMLTSILIKSLDTSIFDTF